MGTCRAEEYLHALRYLEVNGARVTGDGREPRLNSRWTSAMAPGGLLGRASQFQTHGTVFEEQALVRARSRNAP